MNIEPLLPRLLPRRRPAPPAGLREPPLLSGGLPVVGHTVEFVRSTIGLLSRAQRELGDVAALEIVGKKMVAVFGPAANEAVFRAPDSQLNPSDAYKIMTPIFGKGVMYDAPPEKMNEQLKMLLPALKDRRMRTYGEIVVEEVEESIAGWGERGELDLVSYCRVLTNYTSSHCLLGREFRRGMTEEFAAVYHSLEGGVTPIAYLNAHLPLPSFRARDRARARLLEMVTELIQERRRSGRQGEDFLQTLMESRYQSGAPLTEDEITGMLVGALFAGHHTSSVTTAWAILELAGHPAYLSRVLGELDAAFAGGDQVGFASLRNIPLTERAVLEVLRLHPPLYMLVRVAMEDFRHAGYFIPKGTWVLLSPTVSHRIPAFFHNPEVFDPDRFAPPATRTRATSPSSRSAAAATSAWATPSPSCRSRRSSPSCSAATSSSSPTPASRATSRAWSSAPGSRAACATGGGPPPPEPRASRSRRRRSRRPPAATASRSTSTSARATAPAPGRCRRCSRWTGWARSSSSIRPRPRSCRPGSKRPRTTARPGRSGSKSSDRVRRRGRARRGG